MQIIDEAILRILSMDGSRKGWERDLERLEQGDATLTRRSAGEAAIMAVQRMLVFLGYSTASSGAFLIDGDFGRGTNRGVAQFQVEHGLNPLVNRDQLCYPCTYNTARSRIVSIPDVRLDPPTLEHMAEATRTAINQGNIPFGDLEHALFHLNSLQRGMLLDCRQIVQRYGPSTHKAVERIEREKGIRIHSSWILAIIKQETSGIARPRFEQHKLSRFNEKYPQMELDELRVRSMSIGLGQIMGFNYKRVGAASARAMLYSPVEEQVLFVARFIAAKPKVVTTVQPTAEDFAVMARYYNGPAYAKHFYHERLQRWFREFEYLRSMA